MSDEKYYIPKIDEFYIGFEFEELLQGKPSKMRAYSKEELKAFPYNWVKLKLNTSHSMSNITRKTKDGKIRVKYLDASDVEELGFKITDYKGSKVYNINDIYYLWYSKFGDLHPHISIGVLINDKDEQYFRGIIKNKSELKKILKMLCIV